MNKVPIMRRLPIISSLLALGVALASCSKDYQEDIDRLNQQNDRVEQRVERLEQSVSRLNQQLQQISALSAAVEQNFYVTAVTNTGNGYELSLSNGGKMVFQKGTGNTLVPVPGISISQISGFYYWSLNGSLLMGPDGKPIRSSGFTPILRYDETLQEYLISVDGGVTFQSINVYASTVINDQVLLQVINYYFSEYNTVLISEDMLFQVISTYIRSNTEELFDQQLLDQVIATYIREHDEKFFSYELLEEIFSQYNFAYYTSQIDVDHLVGVIIDFIHEHSEVLSSNEVLFEIVSSYLRVNQTEVFSSEMLLEIINTFFEEHTDLLDVNLLTRIVANYIDTHRDVIFDTQVVRSMLMQYVQSYYTKIFHQDILVRILNQYVSSSNVNIFNEELIREILSGYVQNNFYNIFSQEMVYRILNTYVDENAGTLLNIEVLSEVITNYFEKNYNLFIDRTVIVNLFNTYIEEHKETIISKEIIEDLVKTYIQDYYYEVFSIDRLSVAIKYYFSQNMEVLKEYVNEGTDVIKDVTLKGDVCYITLSDNKTVDLMVYDAYARLRDRLQSIVVIPEKNGHVKEEKSKYNDGGVIWMDYLLTPASMAQVICNKYYQNQLTLEFYVTDGEQNVSTLEAVEAFVQSEGLVRTLVQPPVYGTVKTIALRIKEDGAGGSDLMTEFTPVDSEPAAPKHESVDLGLSVHWATFNVGAAKPEDYGDYFAWGEIAPKEQYDWSTYKWCEGSYNTLTRYNTDSSYGVVDKVITFAGYTYEDDAARANWNEEWRTPTNEEWTELLNNCTWEWQKEYNGTEYNGYLVTSKKAGYTDKSIFLPEAGGRTSFNGIQVIITINGYYWSSSLSLDATPISAWAVQFGSDYIDRTPKGPRQNGYSVRPVDGATKIPVESVSVAPTSLNLSVGESVTLVATVSPANANNTITWSSSSPSVATVNSYGKVIAQKAGTTTITITAVDGGKSVTCPVKVTSAD